MSLSSRLGVVEERTGRMRTAVSAWIHLVVDDYAWAPTGVRLIASADSTLYGGRAGLPLRAIGRGCFGSWSPDGSRFAYSSAGWVWVARGDGSGRRRLTRGLAVEDWSRDGARLAILRRRATSCGLRLRVHVFRFRDGGVRRVTGERRIIDAQVRERGDQRHAAFSPDGRRLVFSEGPPCGIPVVPAYDPHVIVVPGGGEIARGFASWSPSSRHLVLRRPAGYWSGSNLSVITPSGESLADFVGWEPEWSPDGSRITFVDHYGGISLASIADLRRPRRLASGANPSWSPDGRWIAYDVRWSCVGLRPRCPRDLYVVSPDGGTPRKVGSY